MDVGEQKGTQGPLTGVVVLSLAEMLPGLYATLLLAELGADVIMVERPGKGDPARILPEMFNALARNKRSVTLDLKNPKDQDCFKGLVAKADVVMEGYSPGTASRLGIAYSDLRAVKPGLVYASISGYGQTGPYRDRVGHDLSYQGVVGFVADHAVEPGPTPEFPTADMTASMFAALSVVSALLGRKSTGVGTFIDVSMTDGLLSWMTPMLGAVMNGEARMNTMHSPGYGSFICADGLVLSLSIAFEDYFWKSLCDVLEIPQLSALLHTERMRDQRALREQIRQKILTRSRASWGELFDAARIPWSPVHALADVPSDPHLQARGMFASLLNSSGEQQRYVASPFQFSLWPRIPGKAAPGLGEHNAEILGRS
jgi:crotonobetainyl-CoA:carnitine CoA-transferase CaiB-like acyl-CoA transferase